MDASDITSAVVAGAAPGDIVVADIQLYDKIITVQAVSADPQPNLASEFSILVDGKINNVGGTNTNGLVLLVVWEKHYKWASKFEEGTSKRLGRSPF